MFTDARKNKITELIQQNPYHFSSEKLGEKLSVSARTIRKEIKEINEQKTISGFTILNKTSKGYYLNVMDKDVYLSFQTIHDNTYSYFDVNQKDERIKLFIFLLLNHADFQTIEELAEKMYVSRSTLTNDLDKAKLILNKYDLKLESKVGKGIKLIGKEDDKRYTQLSLIDESLDTKNMLQYFEWKEQDFYLEELQLQLPGQLAKYNLSMADDNIENLIFHILIMVDRIKQGFVMEQSNVYDENNNCGKFVQDVRKRLERLFEVELSAGELDYLYVQIRSKLTVTEEDITSHKQAKVYIDSLLKEINENYYYDLSHDSQLKKDLQTHIYSMLFRVEHKIRVRNPMEQHIKRHYPLAFEVTLFGVEALKEEYDYTINQGEIAYLALHIGASLERNYQVKYERHHSCLIVCGSGYGTARMIEVNMKKTMPDIFVTRVMSAQDYNRLEYIEEDVVITTIQIEERNRPVYQVDTLPSRKQLLQLDRKISAEVNQSIDIFSRFFSPELFIKANCENKNDVIERMSNLLEAEGVLDKRKEFVDSIHEREQLGSTVLGEGIAVPHPMGIIAKRTKVGVVLLEKPVTWAKNQQVQLIFLLAISKQNYEDALGIYDFLVEVIRENEFASFVSANNFNEFVLKGRHLLKNIEYLQ
ncbi:BglG family transcription antiterminator [Gracilibacillus sp. S3-1-1]|uniref:BglG family transcription antiterminator n=1 Tax=Gracilibacillus pellucidus TaxID=3095368 RepID=A0ACC6M098_9BACI|nr:BglG family transcription antiterminator [Gracilibacillus sp. S3-1-1]MDX8044366.1 BglG family transcription antiterminator [Gracilibacillus sp. S3-1-1]